MSAKVYACLLGQWIDITEEDTLINGLTINEWLIKESPVRADRLDEEDLNIFKENILKSPLIDIFYKNSIYSINPIFLQIVR